MSDLPAVQVRDLTVTRGGNRVFTALSLEVAPSMITGLLGPSGSGKTTLMRAIVGVQRVDGGTVEVFGRPAGSAGARARVGYVTQFASVYGDLSVVENLRYFAHIAAAPVERVDEALDVVGLGDRRSDVVGRLSGGQRGRVSLAAALLSEPALLVMDEPTVGLDPVLRRDLWSTFRELADRGIALLVSSHVMEEAAECDRLLLLRGGDVLADTTPARLLDDTGAPELGSAFLSLIDRRAA